jgi:hypothetical protein
MRSGIAALDEKRRFAWKSGGPYINTTTAILPRVQPSTWRSTFPTMGVMSGYLFVDGGELRDYLDSRKAMLVEEVQKAPEGHVLQVDVEACQRLMATFLLRRSWCAKPRLSRRVRP